MIRKIYCLFIGYGILTFILSSCKDSPPNPDYLPDESSAVIGWTVGTQKVLQNKSADYINEENIIKISAAKNEYEPFQIVIRSGNELIQDLEIDISDLKSSSGSTISKDIIKRYVPHYFNITSSYNPSRSSGIYPDALIPIEKKTVNIGQNRTTSVWITIYVPKEKNAGIYTGEIKVKQNGKILKEFTLELNVWDFMLPNKNSQETTFGLWYWQIAPEHGYDDPLSPGFLPVAWNYYWFLVDHRITPREMPGAFFSDKWHEAARDERVSTVLLPWPSTDAHKTSISSLRDENLLKKGYVYTMDEPSFEEYGKVADLGKNVHREYGNDARMLITLHSVHPLNQLIGAIDIWSPVLSVTDHIKSNSKQSEGEKVWWYTCVSPKAPYPTYFIDDFAISPRILSWLQVKNKVDGTLYWSTSVFKKWNNEYYVNRDIWNDPEAFPNTYGDGYLLYPGTKFGINGPIGSIRLEMIREGNEDLEYFALLKNKLKISGKSDTEIDHIVNELINPVATDFTNWTKQPEILYQQREKLADAILQK